MDHLLSFLYEKLVPRLYFNNKDKGKGSHLLYKSFIKDLRIKRLSLIMYPLNQVDEINKDGTTTISLTPSANLIQSVFLGSPSTPLLSGITFCQDEARTWSTDTVSLLLSGQSNLQTCIPERMDDLLVSDDSYRLIEFPRDVVSGNYVEEVSWTFSTGRGCLDLEKCTGWVVVENIDVQSQKQNYGNVRVFELPLYLSSRHYLNAIRYTLAENRITHGMESCTGWVVVENIDIQAPNSDDETGDDTQWDLP